MSTVTSLVRLGPADQGRAMTLEEFVDAEADEGYRYELARGVLEVTDVPDDDHGQIVCNLYRLISDFDREHPGIIKRYGGGSEFRLWLPAMASGRNPDVAVSLRHSPRDWRGRRPASLAFEVVSKGTEARERDYVTKRAEYLAYGLREYWIVDPEAKCVTVLTRDGDAWVEQAYYDDQPACGLVLPGLVVPVSALWVDVGDDPVDRESARGES